MTVINSTFFSNETGRGGNGGDNGDVGGFGIGGNGGPGGDGGAINQAGAGSLTLSNVTFAGNEASPGGPPERREPILPSRKALRDPAARAEAPSSTPARCRSWSPTASTRSTPE